MSGYPEFVKMHGQSFSYQLAPRAKIFRRDQSTVRNYNYSVVRSPYCVNVSAHYYNYKIRQWLMAFPGIQSNDFLFIL